MFWNINIGMPNKSYFEILGSKGKFNFKIATNCRNAQPMAVLHSLRWSLLCYRRKFSSPGCSGQGGQTLRLLFRQLLYCILRFESSTLTIYKELSRSIFQSLWVRNRGTWPYLHFFFKYIKALSWPSHINFHQLPTHTDSDHQVPTITVQYTASSRRDAQMSQLDLVCYVATKVKNSICFESKYIYHWF